MAKHVFIEENGIFKIETDIADQFIELNPVYHKTILSDVDLIIVKDKKVIFMEYKNANIPGTSNPSAFENSLTTDEHYIKIARKYYDSLQYVDNKPLNEETKEYYYVVEARNLDTVLRARLTGKIKRKLPFDSLDALGLSTTLINTFKVVSIEEWNSLFPEYAFKECAV